MRTGKRQGEPPPSLPRGKSAAPEPKNHGAHLRRTDVIETQKLNAWLSRHGQPPRTRRQSVALDCATAAKYRPSAKKKGPQP